MTQLERRVAKLEATGAGPSRVHVIVVPDGLEHDRPTIERAKAEKGIVCGPRDTLVIVRNFSFMSERKEEANGYGN